MPLIINRPDLKFVQLDTHCSFHSSIFPMLDKRINFNFDSLVAGDVIKRLSFEGNVPAPLQYRNDTVYEFVGVKKSMWKIPMLDAMFFVSKDRSGSFKSSLYDAALGTDIDGLPYAFSVLFVGSGTSSCLVPKPNRHTQPVGIISSVDKLYNVTSQRMALVDKDSTDPKAYAALAAAASKRYHNDVKLDMLNAYAVKNQIHYTQGDIAKITGISARQIRSTYNDKWQQFKNIEPLQRSQLALSASSLIS